ncbi:MAG: DNA replication/repair protein RecF, partial [Pseudomonadota bacterium]|nr:DNA replication/repair protein RecF [Pseudomonadota bacterium]
SILEAISCLTSGRGLRRANLGDLVYLGNKQIEESMAVQESLGKVWAVAANVLHNGIFTDIATGIEASVKNPPHERRIIRIDGKNQKNQMEIGKYFSSLWLTPQMDRLFVDGASGRRRFIDKLVASLNPEHAGPVSAYERSMRNRNKLLRESSKDRKWISSLEDTMARYGVAVVAARRDIVSKLAEHALVEIGSFPGANIQLTGKIESWLDEWPALETEDLFRSELARSRERDREIGGAQLGPHRSDLYVKMNPGGLQANSCSTGEQKALLVRIILAATLLQAKEKDRVPILLLDEISAHLDSNLRADLFEFISEMGAQAWMTGTDKLLFESFGEEVQYLAIARAV